MSSPPLSAILGSAVFQRVLAACAVFVLLALAAVWALGGTMLWQVDRQVTAQLSDAIEEAADLYYAEGPEALVTLMRIDGEAIWDEDAIYYFLEEEEPVYVLRDRAFEPLAGFPGLWADEAVGTIYLDHDEIGDPLRGRSLDLRGGAQLSVALFVPERYFTIWWFLQFVSLALVCIVLPLALITGFWLSRGVFRRLDGIAATAETVAQGALDSRAPQTGAGDEFDRLAGGFNHMLDQVQALTRNIESVSVGVAHDLRTPLANIGGRLELIDRDAGDTDAVRAHVDAAQAHLDQMLRIFDALLRLGEVEAGRRRDAFATVDLSALVQDLGEAFAPLFEDGDKRLTVSVAPGLAVTGDAALLQQMLANLLENALDHARDGAKVALELGADGTDAVLRVVDDGPGIPEPLQARVFERFFRADASRTKPGNGLGLALVKGIAELHDGRVTLAPDSPGADFRIRLPRG